MGQTLHFYCSHINISDINHTVHIAVQVAYVIQCSVDAYAHNKVDLSLTVEVCPALDVPAHGTINTPLHVYGTVVTALCNHGYMFEDEQTMTVVTCVGVAGWSTNITDCTSK